MDQESQVFTAEVAFEGERYSASYYIEHNVINANIQGRMMSTVVTVAPAEQTVKALLLEYLLQSQPKGWHRSDGLSNGLNRE